ncbi:CRISPR-associated protein Csx14 [Azospirillaceae bacterium]
MTGECVEDFQRRIVLSAVGLTPQVVTETLYALTMRSNPFMPTEVHLVTTGEGRHRAQLTLLGGDRPALSSLAEDVGRPTLAGVLKPENIHVISDAAGRPLDDIVSDVDNAAAADFITRLVRRLTADEKSAVHASIAGGRKTFGFLLGYALSLYGRPQDALSHVLVNEPFQSHPEFYYPPSKPRVLYSREQRPISTSDAVITLAEIPFVRLRQGLPESLLSGDSGYTATIVEAQAALAPPSLTLNYRNRRLVCHRREVRLPPLLLAFYVCFIRRRINNGANAAIHWTELSADEVLAEYGTLFGTGNEAFERVCNGLPNGMTKEWFEQKKADLNKRLRNALGAAASIYLLNPVGRRPRTRFILDLPVSSLHME